MSLIIFTNSTECTRHWKYRLSYSQQRWNAGGCKCSSWNPSAANHAGPICVADIVSSDSCRHHLSRQLSPLLRASGEANSIWRRWSIRFQWSPGLPAFATEFRKLKAQAQLVENGGDVLLVAWTKIDTSRPSIANASEVLSFSGHFLQVPVTACRPKKGDMPNGPKISSWKYMKMLESRDQQSVRRYIKNRFHLALGCFTNDLYPIPFGSIPMRHRIFSCWVARRFCPGRLLTAEELQGYDLVLGPKSCAEDCKLIRAEPVWEAKSLCPKGWCCWEKRIRNHFLGWPRIRKDLQKWFA